MNKALLDTDILSEVGKGIDQTVARNATSYRQAYGFLTLSVISVMEAIAKISASFSSQLSSHFFRSSGPSPSKNARRTHHNTQWYQRVTNGSIS